MVLYLIWRICQETVYALDISKISWENFAVEMYSPSYLSFEWALAKYNILSQKPVNLTLATAKKSKKYHSSKCHHLPSPSAKTVLGFYQGRKLLNSRTGKGFFRSSLLVS